MSQDQTDIFNTPEGAGTPDDNPVLDDLVGEGKKFKDINALAASKVAADQHIERIQRENQDMRSELDKIATIEERLNAIAQTPDDGANHDPDTEGNTEVDVNKLVQDAVTAHRAQERVEGNKDTAINAIIEATGSEAAAIKLVADKAKELGVSAEVLRSQAEQSPQLLLATLGIKAGETKPADSSTDAPLTGGTHNHMGSGFTDPKTDPSKYSYYQELRKKDSRKYFSIETQNAISAHVAKNGVEWMDT